MTNKSSPTKLMKAWLDREGSLPPYNTRAVRGAFEETWKQVRACAKTLITAPIDRTAIIAWTSNIATLDSLRSWIELADPDAVRGKDVSQLWCGRQSALCAHLARRGVPAAMDRFASREKDHEWAALTRIASTILKVERRPSPGSGEPQSPAVIAARFERSLENLSTHRESAGQGIQFTKQETARMQDAVRSSARKFAKDRHLEGGWLPAGNPLLLDAAAALVNEPDRELAWSMNQTPAMSDAIVDRLLASRQLAARRLGYTSFREIAARAQAHDNPAAINRVLERILRGLGNIQRPWFDALAVYAASVKELQGVDPTRPWNELVINDHLINSTPADTEPSVFPTVSTLCRALPELVTAIGWTPTGQPTRYSNRHWGFHATRQDGVPVTIHLFPYRRKTQAFDDASARTSLLRAPTQVKPDSPLDVSIEIMLRPSARFISVEDLRLLAHEVGHIGHYYGVGAGHTTNDEAIFPSDVCEFPSILLEEYITPSRLASWVCATAKPKYHAKAFWARLQHPRNTPQRVLLVVRESLSEYAEWLAHAPGRQNVSAAFANAATLARLPPIDPRDSTKFNGFLGLGPDYASRSYVYCYARVLVAGAMAALGPDPSAEQVATTYRAFLATVGHAWTGPSVRRAWKAWRGEDISTSLRLGTDAHLADLDAHNRKFIASNRLLKRSRRSNA